MHDPNAKASVTQYYNIIIIMTQTTGKELPPEVVEYLETKGKDRIVHRKYEVPSVPNELTLVAADPKLPERKTDEFGRPRVAAHAH